MNSKIRTEDVQVVMRGSLSAINFEGKKHLRYLPEGKDHDQAEDIP